MATLSPAWTHHGEMLGCQASNKDGHDGITISVTLDVRVPPKSLSMSDSNGAFTPGGSVSVDQGASHTFTCQTQSRPSASIQWDVGSPPSYQDSNFGPTNPGPGDGLVDTTRTWTFTPRRGNHRQNVTCVANTSDSQQPYPEFTVTLDVNGPPDTPVFVGSASMTENVPNTLTCTADMGYPQDWTLDWSNGGSPITGPPTTSQGSGDRYRFTSVWIHTPRREDNGNIITCTANRASWSSGPEESLGPIDVKFCTLGVEVNTEPGPVNEGSPATWKCRSQTSNPATEWTWSINDVDQSTAARVELTDGDHNGQVSTATFTTGVLSKMDNGAVLTCCAEITTECTANLCSTSVLNVRYAPVFNPLVQPPNPILEGDQVMLTCSVDANPNPSDIIWEKQGPGLAPTPDMSVYQDGSSELTLSNVGRDQAGKYSCKANNGIPDVGHDVFSPEVTVIVHYQVNITSKAMNEIGVNDGENAVLPCIAVGNPRPVVVWYGPNNTEITSDNQEDRMFVTTETIGGDDVYGRQVSSNLTIKEVNSQTDYGLYTCHSSNGIGRNDSLQIRLTGTRRPDKPVRVDIADRTADSLTATWTAGYDGGLEQSFLVYYLKTSDEEEVLIAETDGKTATARDLDDYTEYEIRVYAKNDIGVNDDYDSSTAYTLPKPPSQDSGIVVEFDKEGGVVEVRGLKDGNGCIQLEVRYQDNSTWQECGSCIKSDQTVTLSSWCASPAQRRRRRAVGVIEAVRAKTCIAGLCSQAVQVEEKVPDTSPSVGLIAGASVGGVILVIVIIGLIVYLVWISPRKRNGKGDSFRRAADIQEVELQGPSPDTQPEQNNGEINLALQNNAIYAQVNKDKKATAPLIFRPKTAHHVHDVTDDEIAKKKPDITSDVHPTEQDELDADSKERPIPVKRYIVESGATYTQVNKTNLPPKPPSARPTPPNLPDVTYAVVNNKTPNPPPGDFAAKKKPKKYVPPSSRAVEESAYEDVQIGDKDNEKSSPAADSADNYSSVGAQQESNGRMVTDEGLIYAEVGHIKQHPANQPPIQTEASTEYASLDFARMKSEATPQE